MIYGLFFSAGNQRRFKSPVPKALSKINGEEIIKTNFNNIAPFVNNTYVVCNSANADYFNGYNRMVIDSGKGCGDAVMKALLKINPAKCDFCYIQWGDALVDQGLYELIKHDFELVTIPCAFEKNPYVQVMPYNNTARIKFSKYEPVMEWGLHDQSVFFAPARYLLGQLVDFSKKITKDGQYITPRNNEMLFLDLFNVMNTKAWVLPNKLKSSSFNTLAELHQIQRTR